MRKWHASKASRLAGQTWDEISEGLKKEEAFDVLSKKVIVRCKDIAAAEFIAPCSESWRCAAAMVLCHDATFRAVTDEEVGFYSALEETEHNVMMHASSAITLGPYQIYMQAVVKLAFASRLLVEQKADHEHVADALGIGPVSGYRVEGNA